MDKELNEQEVGADAAAALEGASAEGAASGEATTEGQGAPDVQAQINEAVQAAIKEYEGEGGHLARLRSAKDKQIAALQRQLQQQQSAQVDRAMALVDTDPEQAVQILSGIVQAQSQEKAQGDRQQQVADWQQTIMGRLGYKLDESEEDAALFGKWHGQIVGDDRYTFDFHQEVAEEAVRRANERADRAEKELAKFQEAVPELIKAEITKAMVNAGYMPEPTGDGSTPPKDDNWRENPSISRGLQKRIKRPIQRT